MPGPVDVALVALIVVAAPLDAMRQRRRLLGSLDAGVADARSTAYRHILIWEWGAAAVLIAVWVAAGRSFALLGIVPPAGGRFAIAFALALAITALLVGQMRAAERRPEVAEAVRAATESLAYVLPATAAEMRRFTWVGVTAGIVEELVYRGYLMWVIGSFTPWWVALILSSIAFGIGHAYQGPAGIAKTGAVGLLLGGLYRFSGSIWVPMLVHAATDVLQGRMIYVSRRQAAG